VTVVLAAENYPATPVKGDVITGVEEAGKVPGAYVLHAGTGMGPDGRLVSAGGRVLNVVGTGPDLGAARGSAYEAIGRIGLRGAHHRTDIALEAARST
jgi:phosphoribosylamine--glycine ligase